MLLAVDGVPGGIVLVAYYGEKTMLEGAGARERTEPSV
jgi:hypothetical protein